MTEIPIIVFAAISCLLVPLPFPWHWRAKNIGTLGLMFYLLLGNFDIVVTTSIWSRTFENVAPGWCEISIRIRHLCSFGIPCASLCVARRLESIASTREVRVTERDRKRRLWVDFSVVFLVPFVYLALMIVNQGHRYDIQENIGCWPAMVLTPVYIVLVTVPLLLVSLLSLIYSLLALRWFIIRRRQFSAVLQSTGSNLNTSRYLRMMMFSLVDIVVYLPIAIFIVAVQIALLQGLQPYTSWDDVHYNFGRVEFIPKASLDSDPKLEAAIELGRWFTPINGIFFFLMFGLGGEAVKSYKRLFSWARGASRPNKRRTEYQSDNFVHNRTFQSNQPSDVQAKADIAESFAQSDDIEKVWDPACKRSPNSDKFDSSVLSLHEFSKSHDRGIDLEPGRDGGSEYGGVTISVERIRHVY